MPDFGIVKTGFKRKRYVDILADMQSRARANFGDSIVADTNKPLGKFLDVHAWALAELWEELEETYNSIAIDTAEGTALDRIVKYKGLRRLQLAFATSSITIRGTPGIFVPTNFIVGKVDTTTYYTTADGTIPPEGIIELPITASVAGSRGNAEIGDVNVIVTPITGITSVTNMRVIVNGQDFETDRNLRERYISTVGGLSTVESIRAATFAIPGVVSNLVVENSTMEIDEYGIPPKSFAVYIYGGDDYDIAQAIMDSKAAGIQAFGSTMVVVKDVNGFDHDIGFTRATVVDIDVKITVKTNQFFPYNGNDLIRQNVLSYIGGNAPDGTQHAGLKINSNVINSYIQSVVWPIGGITDVSTQIARSGNPLDTANIEIGQFEIAKTSFPLIEVVSMT